MKAMQNWIQFVVLGAILLALPGTVRAQIIYTQYIRFGDYLISDSDVREAIASYDGTDSILSLPGRFLGKPIVGIEALAFYGCSNLVSVMIPSSVTNIGGGAFANCPNLMGVFFKGDAPSIDSASIFTNSPNLTVYYLSGSKGWNTTYSGRPTALWQAPTQFAFKTNANSTITVTGYIGFDNFIVIPSNLVGLPVTSIGHAAFYGASITNLQIPDCVTSIGNYAFADCGSLTTIIIGSSVTNIGYSTFAISSNLMSVYCGGNAPSIGDTNVFYSSSATVFYLPKATGWKETFAGRPTALWLPTLQAGDGSSGAHSNQFGFNINWASGQTVVVDACTNLSNLAWQPVQTNTLPSSGTAYFSDPQWTNYPGRFYRLRSS